MSAGGLVESLGTLRDRVARLRLGLVTPGVEAARAAQGELVHQVDDYLLPRLRRLDAPLLAVVGGSTGAGKSTLVNTLVGATVSRAGWLRPTTRGPVLVCHPDDLHWFTDGSTDGSRNDLVLPDLPRTTGAAPDGGDVLHVVPHRRVPPGLALLDAPDVDSVVADNRRLAAQLLAAADLWIFVTTAARYADAVPWDLLHTAQRRSTALAVVLNRVPPDGVDEIRSHLASMLAENGLGRAALFAVPETALDEGDRMPAAAVAPFADWIVALAGDAGARAEVIRTTLDGALRSIPERVEGLAREVDDQAATAQALRGEADEAYAHAVRSVDDGVRGGSVLRGEVLARWQEFVGTGEFTRGLEQRVGRLRDRVTAFLTGRPAPGAAVERALESSVHALVRSASDGAAERTADSWRVRPAGRQLLGDERAALARSSPGFAATLDDEVRAWQGQVLELVAQEGGQRRTVARLASFGTNGAGLALMLAVFAQTGGLSGAELLVAGGTSAVSQKVLEAVFGDSAVRALASRARADLLDRVEDLLAVERARFTERVDAAAPIPDAAAGLRGALAPFQTARRAWRGTTGSDPSVRGAPATAPAGARAAAVPGSAVPGSAVPGSAVPGSAVPRSTVPREQR